MNMTTHRQFNLLNRTFAILALTLAIVLSSCSTDDGDSSSTLVGEWYKKSDFEGIGRSGATVVIIDGKAYVGTGFDGTKWLKDWWQYDPDKDFWIRKADFPGSARTAAVGFAANGKAYVGTGYNGVSNLKDFYEYDPSTDEWSQVADFEGSARYGALAFEINDKGYIGTGYDGNYLKDIWQYDPNENAWEQKVSVGGSKRTNAFAFVIDGKAYVGGGKNNGVLQQDFWEYDPEKDAWTSKTALDDDDDYTISRELASTFVINGYGYIACGTISSISSQVWEYDPSSDTWKEKTSFEGSSRENAIGFAIGNKGYISTGRNSNLRYDDIWQFDPLAEDTD